MEDEDNVILFVVEDELCSKDDLLRKVTAKSEPLEVLEESENEMYEDPNHIEGKEPHTKVEYDVEYLEENDQETGEYKIEYLEEVPIEIDIPEYNNNDNDVDDEDYIENKSNKQKPKMTLRKRNRKGKTVKNKKQKRAPRKGPASKAPEKLESYVDQLRKEYPDLANEEQQLVDHLTSIMRGIKPPQLPDFICEEVKVENQTKYECTVCGVQRDTKATASIHYQYMHGDFYLTCFACGMEFRNTPHLYKHEMRCSAPDAKIVLQARGRYLGRKGRGRPYTTSDKFVTANTLPLQAPKEKGRLFCSKCPASFNHRHNLIAHENTHEGLRPFRCKHCTMAYTSYPALKRHEQLHGECRYVCDHCGRRFQLRPALVAHLDSHRPLRKYPCEMCERRFTQKTSLRHHLNKVHYKLPAAHGCLICPKRYARLGHVKEHMARAHGLSLVSRNMFTHAMPAMTDSEIIQARKLFNFDATDGEYILPDVTNEVVFVSRKEMSQVNNFVSIIQKKRPTIAQVLEPKEEERQGPIIVRPSKNKVGTISNVTNVTKVHTPTPVETKAKRKKEKEETTSKENENKKDDTISEGNENKKCLKPKRKRKTPQRKIEEPESPVKIDEQIDDGLCNIEYKRQKKQPTITPDIIKPDEDMYKIVRDIKSTLSNRKAENTRIEKRNSKKNFYEIKREFLDNLKKEIDIPVVKKEVLEVESEELVPGTEIPEILAPNRTENVTQERKNADDDDEKWKEYADVSEKNKVLANFIEYMSEGVVPKHVPILRRGQQTKRKK